MNSSPGTTYTDSDSTRKPLDSQRPIWENLWGQISSALNSKMPQQFIAGPNDTQRQYVAMLKRVAPGLNDGSAGLRNMAQKISSGFFLNPQNDPTFKGAANAAIDPVTKQLRGQVLPQIVDRSMRMGGTGGGPAAYGGARQDIQENSAVNDWSRTAGGITADMANKSRMAGMSLIPQAGGMLAQANQLDLAPSMITGLAGNTIQGWQQGALDDEIKKYLFQFAGPGQAANILSTGGWGTQSGSQTTTGPAPDMMTQWLQGLTGGASGLASLFGTQGAFPGFMPWLMPRAV